MKVQLLIAVTIFCVIDCIFAQSRLFTGQKSLRCTNYGDPHIFPFQGEMQTCSLCGTHTLVKNDWIIATATVEYVNMTFSRATFVSKINIAFFNQDGILISTFGSEDIELGCSSFTGFLGSGDHIRAYISRDTATAYLYYKQTKINVFIRKNRFGYSFGIYLPESMLSHSNGVCVTGCPADQVLRIEAVENPVVQSRIASATQLCRQRFATVNDPQIEARIRACVFDVAVTGDSSLAAEHILEISDESMTADENHQARKRSLDDDLQRARRVNEMDVLNRPDSPLPAQRPTLRSSGRLRSATPVPVPVVETSDIIVLPDQSIALPPLPPVQTQRPFNRRTGQSRPTNEVIILEEQPVQPVVERPIVRRPGQSRIATTTTVEPFIAPIEQPVQLVERPISRRPGQTRLATTLETIVPAVNSVVEQPQVFRPERPARRPGQSRITNVEPIITESNDALPVQQEPVSLPPVRRPGQSRQTTAQPIIPQTTEAPAIEQPQQPTAPLVGRNSQRPFSQITEQPQSQRPASPLSVVDTEGKICIPIDCSLTNLGGNTPRFAYPGKEMYFFECSADGVVQTRRCPINNLFDGTTCVPQEF